MMHCQSIEIRHYKILQQIDQLSLHQLIFHNELHES